MNMPKSPFSTKTIPNNNTTTSIIHFLSAPYLAMVTVLEKEFRYLSGVSLYFEGFKELQDSQRLVTYLIDEVSTSDGTQRVVVINNEFLGPSSKS